MKRFRLVTFALLTLGVVSIGCDAVTSEIDPASGDAESHTMSDTSSGERPAESSPSGQTVEELEGKWKVVSTTKGAGPIELPGTYLNFLNGSAELTSDNGGVIFLGDIIHVDRNATPSQIDFTKSGQAKLAIYHLEGNRLEICIPDTGLDRPNAMTGSQTCIIYTAEKVEE